MPRSLKRGTREAGQDFSGGASLSFLSLAVYTNLINRHSSSYRIGGLNEEWPPGGRHPKDVNTAPSAPIKASLLVGRYQGAGPDAIAGAVGIRPWVIASTLTLAPTGPGDAHGRTSNDQDMRAYLSARRAATAILWTTRDRSPVAGA